MSLKDGIWDGRYPQQVPGSLWAAWSVWNRAERTDGPFYTEIYPHMDDPCFEWRTVENSPWLTAAQCEVINAPHRKKFWRKEARTFACDKAADDARWRAHVLLCMEPVHKHAYFHPNKPFHNQYGGYVPN